MADGCSSIREELKPILYLVESKAHAADKLSQPDLEVIKKLAESDLLNLLVPREYGGRGEPLSVLVEFSETLAFSHGSTAWVAMTCNEEAGIAAAYLPPENLKDLWSRQPDVIIAGSGVPHGRAHKVEGGWELSGRWNFVSGCTSSDKWILNSIVQDSSPLQLCFALINADYSLIEKTWFTSGLRGTGSNDVVLHNHFVPYDSVGVVANHSLPIPETPSYRLPSGLRFPFPKTGIATGLAFRAIHEFKKLCGTKKPLNSKLELRNRPDASAAIAKAEALVRSGKTWVTETLHDVWASVAAGSEVTSERHALARLACSWSVQNSVAAVELITLSAGSSSNFETSPLSRLAADIRAVAGHFTVGNYQIDTAGRVLLGLDSDDRSF
ncbi:MAG: hypothetical protein GWP30_07530 [Actinobacteria bacterium]|nr:hypothetical protein [Actinomycetota bacterium]